MFGSWGQAAIHTGGNPKGYRLGVGTICISTHTGMSNPYRIRFRRAAPLRDVFKRVVTGIIVYDEHVKISVVLQEQRIDALYAFRPTMPVHQDDRGRGLRQAVLLRARC